MDDEPRKALTKYCREIFHNVCETGTTSRCACGKKFSTFSLESIKHIPRTFATPDDMAAVRKAIIEKGDWIEFIQSAFYYGSCETDIPMGVMSDSEMDGENNYYNPDFILWLTDPVTFCAIAGEWVKLKEC